jgi:hypothetical protein
MHFDAAIEYPGGIDSNRPKDETLVAADFGTNCLTSRKIPEYETHRLPSAWKSLPPHATSIRSETGSRQEQQESRTLADFRGPILISHVK